MITVVGFVQVPLSAIFSRAQPCGIDYVHAVIICGGNRIRTDIWWVKATHTQPLYDTAVDTCLRYCVSNFWLIFETISLRNFFDVSSLKYF